MTTKSDKRVAASLKALGIDKEILDDPREKIYEALVHLWKEKSGPPEVREIAAIVGSPPSTVGHHLSQLAAEGRVARLRKGVWLPLVE